MRGSWQLAVPRWQNSHTSNYPTAPAHAPVSPWHTSSTAPTSPTPPSLCSYEAGNMTHEQASLVKAWNTLRGREVRMGAAGGLG